MVKTRISVCSAMVFAMMLALSSVQCAAEEAKVQTESTEIEVNEASFQPRLEDLYINVKINIHRSGAGSWTIKEVVPKGPDICNDLEWALCDGSQFLWTVIGHQMASGEQVIIRKAPHAPSCFNWDEWVIEGPDSAIKSGPVTCVSIPEQAKYGTLWPYDVEFWKDGKLMAETDPRGIVH